MSPWDWKPARHLGIWRHGAGWLHPLAVAAPYLMVLLLVQMFYLIGGTLTSAKGVLFDLPAVDQKDGEMTRLVALMMPMGGETLVFFDDSRYLLSDGASVGMLADSMTGRFSRSETKTLLVLADHRVSGGELMKLADLARSSGVQKVLFAEKGVSAE